MENMDKKDCQICCEKIRYSVLCECKFEVCRNCVRTYLAGQVSEPHCMNCKLAWNMEFLENAIGKTYLKTDYKKQRAIVFAEFEKTQLPDMQEEARIYDITDRLNTEIKNINKENDEYKHGTFGCNWCIGGKYKMFAGCHNCKNASEQSRRIQMENIRIMNLSKFPEKIYDKIKRYDEHGYNSYMFRYCNNYRFKCSNCFVKYNSGLLFKILNGEQTANYIECEECEFETCFRCFGSYSEGHVCNDVECNCYQYECDTCLCEENERKISALREQIQAVNNKSGQTTKERKTFIMRCQINGCEGYLSQQYKCGLCTKYTCSSCYMPKNDNHTCNPDDVASTKMIKDETRPCPKCSTRIYKIDGCDQMWCTDCKTAFSWKTGIIVNGNIHNPHYYEYLRNTQGNVPRADEPYNPCGEILNQYQLRAFRQQFITYIKSSRISTWIDHYISAIHRYLGEVNDILETTQAEVNDMTGDRFVKHLRHNRILFLLKRIEKDKFEQNAFMYHQRSTQFRRFLELVQMLKQVVLDIFNKMYAEIVEEADKKKNLDPNKIINTIIQAFNELFGVVRYFRSQHTNNPFTKIVTDHYDTAFVTVVNRKTVLSFEIPNELEFPSELELKKGVNLYQLSFAYYTDDERSGKKANKAAAACRVADY